ncbi:MAG: RNA 3'-terminal phosphate cyclase [Phycisphaerales bacterium]|nr:RNA 3'-terminal phosphate cyclase [Phycisphaerales bacterium]
MIQIDGSFGEGGGQILRSSIALAMVTGSPVRIEKIRAGRSKPGLMRQHLTAVQAATKICNARVSGDAIGSTQVTFEPGQVAGGDYTFGIGTAGSTTLVLQTIMLPLLCADRPSRITLDGGTHNPFAPPFDFLERAYLPLVNRMGPSVRATLERPGFFPAGGGRIVIEIEPAPMLQGFELLERGELRRRHARAAIANLSPSIGDREIGVIARRLGWEPTELAIDVVSDSRGPGNIVTLTLEYEHVTEVFTGFGEVKRSAEAVATHAVQACQRYQKHTAPVGEYLTDQLMLPMALAGNGAFASTGLSRHSETHIELIRRFLNTRIRAERHTADSTLITFSSGVT